jgi:hypothetical protein
MVKPLSVRHELPTKPSGQTLHELADELHRAHGLIMFKAGSEWEDMDLAEIAFLKGLGSFDIPVLMKVSGLESRTEIRHLFNMGVNYFLAPMIENEFGLEKFVNTVSEVGKYQNKTAKIAIMIETFEAYKNLEQILNSNYFDSVAMVVLGRLDLANSMGKQNVDDPQVKEISKSIIQSITSKGIPVSVGGFVNPSSAPIIKAELKPTMINTINMLLDLSKSKDISKAVELALQLERAFYESLIPLNRSREGFYQTRIDITAKKLMAK